jgi:hypothetical protein
VKFWEGKKTVWQALQSCNNNVNVAKSPTFYGWTEKDQCYRVMQPMLAWHTFYQPQAVYLHVLTI